MTPQLVPPVLELPRRRRRSSAYLETWKGGYVRQDRRGRKVYVIRTQIGGKRYDISTRCHDRDAAKTQLERFEKDPEGYRPGGIAPPEAILLDEKLAAEYLTWSREEKDNSRDWVAKQRLYLAWWADVLEGKDLRHLDVSRDVRAKTKQAPRLAVLKAFLGWLRKVQHRISIAEDPLAQLQIAAAKPAQWKKSKVIPKEAIEAVRKHLAEHVVRGKREWLHFAHALDVLAGTGWHVTEVQRFATSGSIDAVPEAQRGEAAGVLVCWQKKAGDAIRTGVSADVLASAKALRARGRFSTGKFYTAIRTSCEALGVKFTPGNFRATVASWAHERGIDLGAVAAFLNHKSFTTTKKFYATLAVPRKIPTLL